MATSPKFPDTGFWVKENFRRALINSLKDSSAGSADLVRKMGRRFERNVQKTARSRAAIHGKIAKDMRIATQAAYKSSIEDKKLVPSYRVGENRLSGGMRRALWNPGIVTATADTINYMDLSILNTEAKHWARLNFGAKPAPSPRPQAFMVKVGNQRVQTVKLKGTRRPEFSIPIGVFVETGGYRQEGFRSTVNPFYPGYYRPPGYIVTVVRSKKTRGIVGTNFMDAGLAVYAREIGPAYERLFHRVVAETKARPQRGKKTTRA